MALINFGSGTDTATGDTLYNAFTKINNIIGNGNGNVSSCTATGISAMSAVNTGTSNTANGYYALSSNTSGYANTAIGVSTLQANTTGYYNTAIGNSSQSTSTGANGNTSVGAFSLYNANTGNQNTAVGYGSLQNNTTGINNTALGHGALSSNTTFNNSTGLGYNASISASNQVKLGDTNVTTVVSSGTASFSDIRDKADIRDTILGLDFVNSLRAVDYKWDYREDYRTEMPNQLNEDATEEEKESYRILMDEWIESCKFSNLVHDGSKKRNRYHHGLIAQEVQEVIESSGVDFGGFQDHTVTGGDEVMTVTYTELIAPMIKAIQELTARINVLEGN